MKPNLIPIAMLICLCVGTKFRTAVAAALSIQELPNGQVQVAWPSDPVSFSLEQTDSLTSPLQWRAVNGTVVNAGGRFSVLIQPSTQTRFYRLRAGVAAAASIIETSPASGETGVAVTRETIFRLSAPLDRDPCKTQRRLAQSAYVQCGGGIIGAAASYTVLKHLPGIGCGISFAQGILGFAADCIIDNNNCGYKSVISQGVSTVLGCVPMLGGASAP